MNPIGPGGKKPASGGGKFGYGPKSWNGLSCGKYANSSPIIGNPLRPPLPGKNPLPVTIPFVICFILRSLLRLFWNHTWNVIWIITNNWKLKGRRWSCINYYFTMDKIYCEVLETSKSLWVCRLIHFLLMSEKWHVLLSPVIYAKLFIFHINLK